MAATASKAQIKTSLYAWEGTDKKGSRITGISNATNVAMVRAELRRQGVNPLKIKKNPPLSATEKRRSQALILQSSAAS
jgi:type IV pilus assembly protein PilC